MTIDTQVLINAIRNKYRFENAAQQVLTFEDLYDIPMTGTRGLESVAQNLNSIIKKDDSNETFFGNQTKENKRIAQLKEKLEIVIFVGKQRMEEKENNRQRQEEQLKEQRNKQIAIDELSRRQNESITKLSDEELQKLANS